jgi:dUTPase
MLYFFRFILVKKGDRIAQLICEKIEMANLVEEQVRFCVSIFLIY